jgi:hypothetical protein
MLGFYKLFGISWLHIDKTVELTQRFPEIQKKEKFFQPKNSRTERLRNLNSYGCLQGRFAEDSHLGHCPLLRREFICPDTSLCRC